MSFDFELVRRFKPEFSEINKVLQKAHKSIRSAELLLRDDPEGALTMAYEGMLKSSLALMFSNGYRPRVQQGHHKTLVLYARYMLKGSLVVVDSYERLRRKRNKAVYDTEVVTKTEAKNAVEVSCEYFDIVEAKIATDNPQQKLWSP